MKFMERISIRRGRLIRKVVFLLGMPVYQYIKQSKNLKLKKHYSLVLDKFKPEKDQRIFYLKVHRVHKTSIDCVKQWVKIARKMNAFIYFVCDNPQMEKDIKRKIKFKDYNFRFIKSDRKSLKSEVLKILDNVERAKLWQRIAYSMLTPFLHADKYGHNLSYNIDADDILLCMGPDKISEAFFEAEKYAKKNNIDLFNFDMFYTKSFGVHWSFGIVMCTNPKKCLNAIKANTNWHDNRKFQETFNICWLNKYNFNIDWFFTYLRDTRQLNMKTFYIENGMVAHMPDYILEHGWSFLIKWQEGNVYFPILSNLYDCKTWNSLSIPSEAVKIDVGLNCNSSQDFFKRFYNFSVFFEKDMLNYAKTRGLISDVLFQRYSSTPQYLDEIVIEKNRIRKQKVLK